MDFLSDFANALWEKVNDIITWLIELLSMIFDALWLFLGDILAWSFDGILSIVIGAINSLDLSGLSGYSSAWGGFAARGDKYPGLTWHRSSIGNYHICHNRADYLATYPICTLGVLR